MRAPVSPRVCVLVHVRTCWFQRVATFDFAEYARRSRKEDLGLRPLGTADLIRPATPPEMRLRVEEVIRGPSPGPIQGEAVPDEKDDA